METVTVYDAKEKAFRPNNKPYALYCDSWGILRQLIELKLNTIFQSIFEKVIHFIDYSHLPINPTGYSKHTVKQFTGFETWAKQVPTAVLLAGVNTPDHQLIYDRIQASVQARGGRVAIVNPGTDVSSSRLLISAVVRQFLQDNVAPTVTKANCDRFDSDEGGIDDALVPESADVVCADDFMKQFSSSVRFTYWALSEWYRHKIRFKQNSHVQNSVKLIARISRRSLSQPDPDRILKHNRPTRSSLFSRTNYPRSDKPSQVQTRRFTVRSEVSPANIRHTPVTAETSSPPSSAVDAGMVFSGQLVIILPQVEAIPSHVLHEFIELTSMYVSGQSADPSHTLPICLVLGLSTNPEVGFEARLNSSTLSKLQIEWFTVPPPAAFLDAVFNALLDFPGFHLAHSMCTYLVDSLFLCLDYSVQNFVRRLQFCMLEHYLNISHPELLLPPDTLSAYLERISSTDLANMVSLCFPSIASLAADNSSSPPRLPTVDRPGCGKLTSHLADHLESHWHLQYMVGPVLRWLLNVAASITVAPLGKSVSEVYRRWLKDGLVPSEEFIVFKNLLSGLSKDVLVNSLDTAASILESDLENHGTVRISGCVKHLWPEPIRNACNKRLLELVRSARTWMEILNNADTQFPTTPRNPPSSPLTPVSNIPVGQKLGLSDRRRKISLRTLRQHLHEVAAESPGRCGFSRMGTAQTEWERSRTEFVSWMVSQIQELIPCPTSLPLHEVFYGPGGVISLDNWKQLPITFGQRKAAPLLARRHLNPPYQKCLHEALANPGQYIQITTLRSDLSDTFNSNLPDISILYKLYLESGKMVNLYDWLMAFATVLGEDTDADNPPSKFIQARFFHGIAQLHHLGYIKSTKRKADHVIRLTWGLVA